MSKRRFLIALIVAAVLSTISASQQSNQALATEKGETAPAEVAANAPVLGPEVTLSWALGGGDDSNPVVAYNRKQASYMVAYRRQVTMPSGSKNQYVYAHPFPDLGMTVPGDPKEGTMGLFGAYGQVSEWPHLAFNETDENYLLVYSEAPSDDGWASQYAIRGAVVSDSTMGMPFNIWEWRPSRGLWHPHVAWNSDNNQYLVVWSARNTADGTFSDVAGARLSANGTLLGGGAIIFNTFFGPQNVDVTYSPASKEYLVVWTSRPAADAFWLFGKLIRADGTTSRETFPIAQFNSLINSSNPNAISVFPSVAARQSGYIVVWPSYDSYYGHYNLYAQELDSTGHPVGETFPIFPSSDSATQPVVVSSLSSDTDVAAFWTRSTVPATADQIWGYRLGYPVPDYVLSITSPVSLDRSQPAVAMGRRGYFVVYKGVPTGGSTPAKIYGRIWSLDRRVFLPFIRR